MTNFRLSNLYVTMDIYETNFLDLKLTQGIIKRLILKSSIKICFLAQNFYMY